MQYVIVTTQGQQYTVEADNFKRQDDAYYFWSGQSQLVATAECANVSLVVPADQAPLVRRSLVGTDTARTRS